MSALEQACFLSNQSWAASLPTEFEEVAYSKRHQRIMNNLIDKMRGNKYHRFTRRVTAALIAAAIFVSMTITAFAIPATREFIIERFFDHSTYSVVGGEYSEVEGITIGYIPEGFEIVDEHKDKNIHYIEYENNNGKWFDVKKFPSDEEVYFDTEHNDYERIDYNGIQITHYYNDNVDCYIWNYMNSVFEINGTIDKKLVFRIIKSVE